MPKMPGSKKDPKRTIERLTQALCFLATSPAPARERYSGARQIILPLLKTDFPLTEDQERFAKIFEATPDTVPDTALGEHMKAIWELYWRMSDNHDGR